MFSHEILNANPYAFLDGAPLEERRARTVQLRGYGSVDAAGILDVEAIDQITVEVWPDLRNADELHDALLTFIAGPAIAGWRYLFQELLDVPTKTHSENISNQRMNTIGRLRCIANDPPIPWHYIGKLVC